jgi:hypothetical protein
LLIGDEFAPFFEVNSRYKRSIIYDFGDGIKDFFSDFGLVVNGLTERERAGYQ